MTNGSSVRFRVMTYNVHRCVGAGGVDSVADIAALCADADADLIALQELDAPETEETDGPHHARDLASRLGMRLLFCRTFRRGVGYYGHALLARGELELEKVTTFASPHATVEPRGAIWARAKLEAGATIDVISTHLGVRRGERSAQSLELLGDGWLGSAALRGLRRSRVVLCGDLNAVPNATTYRRFSSSLRDAQREIAGHRARATFPARLPVLRLDHVFVGRGVTVCGAAVPWNARSRRASDHLPLIVDLAI
ncbi:MAG: endonuclease/exonuclease/phosphatase family protein [Labilithrix sp.]|nr:endonuclease/exonuclease/phosphatase family protein [Labilithrix sp.]